MSRLPFLGLVALALAFPVGALLQPLACPSRSSLPVIPRQPISPLILLTVAGLRTDRIEHLGGRPGLTPALDRLAEEGVTFHAAYAASNDGAASTAALLTGYCPGVSGVRGPGDVLQPRALTLAERLAQDGYACAAFVANAENVGRGFEQGFALFDAQPGLPAALLVERALALIERAPSPSWFVWIDFGDLLAPYGGQGAGLGHSLDDYDLDASEQVARGWGSAELAELALRYDGAVRQLDAGVGLLLDALAPGGRLDMLYLCLAGTRGERLDERPARVFTHGIDLYEPSVRVPLLFRLPAQVPRGLQLTRLVQLTDVYPTLLGLGPRKTITGTQGRSLELVIQQQHKVRDWVLAEGWLPGDVLGIAVRSAAADIKVLGPADGSRWEVYQTLADPLETKDLAPVAGEQARGLVGQAAEVLLECRLR